MSKNGVRSNRVVSKQKKKTKKLERIQRAATKLAPNLADKSYEERLVELNLTTLEEREGRKGGDKTHKGGNEEKGKGKKRKGKERKGESGGEGEDT